MRGFNKMVGAFFLLLCAVCRPAEPTAAFERLNAKSTGQLLGHISQTNGSVTLLSFQGLDADRRRWTCSQLLRGNHAASYKPEEIMILPMTEAVQTHELVIYCVYNLSRLSRSQESLDDVYVQLLKWRGGERADLIRTMLEDADSLARMLAARIEVIRSSSSRTEKAKAREKLKDLLDTSEEDKGIGKIIATLERFKDDGDFFTATCIYNRIRNRIQTVFRDYANEPMVKTLITNMDRQLFSSYSTVRSAGTSSREEAFSKLFPDYQGGVWSQGLPVSYQELQNRAREAYKAFATARALSPSFDFPKWADATLGILSMLTSDCGPEIAFGKAFDEALKHYEENRTQL